MKKIRNILYRMELRDFLQDAVSRAFDHLLNIYKSKSILLTKSPHVSITNNSISCNFFSKEKPVIDSTKGYKIFHGDLNFMSSIDRLFLFRQKELKQKLLQQRKIAKTEYVDIILQNLQAESLPVVKFELDFFVITFEKKKSDYESVLQNITVYYDDNNKYRKIDIFEHQNKYTGKKATYNINIPYVDLDSGINYDLPNPDDPYSGRPLSGPTGREGVLKKPLLHLGLPQSESQNAYDDMNIPIPEYTSDPTIRHEYPRLRGGKPYKDVAIWTASLAVIIFSSVFQ